VSASPTAPKLGAVNGNKRSLRLQVTRNELGHLEHRNSLFTVEDGLELVVGVDLGSHLGVLKLVLLDVVPKLLGKVSPGQRLGPDNSGQKVIGLDGFEKGRIGFAGRLLLRRFLNGFFGGFLSCHGDEV
jgi:hypothetical protein